jgi:hypothetical protein
MPTPNRELSQFGSFINVNDSNKKISIGTTVANIVVDNAEINYVDGYNAVFTGIVTANQFEGEFIGTIESSTNVIGGYADISSLEVSGISTLGYLDGTDANFSGIVTASTFIGNLTGTATTYIQSYSSVVGGVVDVTSLKVSGVSTVGFLTGTDARFSGIVTASSFVGTATSATVAAGLTGNPNISVNNLNVSGITTVGFLTGTNARFTGIITAPTFVGNLTGTATTYLQTSSSVIGGIASVTSLRVSGISTLGTVQISSGIITSTTVQDVVYYGDGSNLKNIKATNVIGITTYADYATYTGQAGVATNLKGGTAYQIPYQSGANTTDFIANGTATGQLLQYNEGSPPSWIDPTGLTATNALYAESAGTAELATDMSIEGTNQLLYQSSTNNTEVLDAGVQFQILQSNGTGSPPSWVDPTNLVSGSSAYSETSGIATNLKGGTAYQVPYQSSADTTEFIPNGTSTGQLLQYNAGSPPSWVDPTNLTIGEVGYASVAGIATVAEGLTGNPNITVNDLNVLGISTLGTVQISSGIITATSGVVTYYGDGSKLTGVAATNVVGTISTATNVIGGIASVTSLRVSGISTLGTVQISSGIITATSGSVTYYGDGSKLTGVVSKATLDSNNNFIVGSGSSTGTFNNLIGLTAGVSISNGFQNNFFGPGAGYSNLTGSDNNFFGYGSGYRNSSGSCNIFIGYIAGYGNETGSFNVVIGPGRNSTPISNGSNQLVIGAGSTDWIIGNSSYNVGIGTTNPQTKLHVVGVVSATSFNGDGSNLSNLSSAKISLTSNWNFIVGGTAGSGCSNIGIGSGVGGSTGSNNNFFGALAGYGNTGSNNNFFGYLAGFTNCGSHNNFFGCFAGCRNTTGCSNNFFGRSAGCYNQTGCDNNFIGDYAGRNNTTGCDNNFIGDLSGYWNSTGKYNNFFGVASGRFNTIGSNNTFIGSYSGQNNVTGDYNVVLGAGRTSTPIQNGSNQLVIGAGSTDWIIGNSSYNVGIGTTNPTSKLQVIGDARIGINTAQGVILTSPNGTAYRLVVNDAGTLTTVAV